MLCLMYLCPEQLDKISDIAQTENKHVIYTMYCNM